MALKRGIVKLEKYNTNWEVEYKKEEELLKNVLGNKIIEIHHIGSTAIPNLMAKPIIDILIAIDNLDNINEIEEILKKYDYTNMGHRGVDDRYFFAKGPDEARECYLHFTTLGSDAYYNQIYFKRYLLEHKEYIKKYCDLKLKLAKMYADDRAKYTESKNDFIRNVILLAHKEYD